MRYTGGFWIRPKNELEMQGEAEEKRLQSAALFAGFCVIGMIVMMLVMGFGLYFIVDRAKAMWDSNRPGGYLIYQAASGLQYCLYMIFPVGITALIFKRRVRPFHQRARIGAAACVALALAGWAFCILANYITNFWLRYLNNVHFPVSTPGSENIQSGWLGLILPVITTALLPGIIEELIFRGYILSALRPFGDGPAILCSALMFGLLHGNMVQVPFAFMLGLVFAFIVVKTGNIVIPMAIHFLNNASATVQNQLGNDPFFGQTKNADLGVVIAAAIVLLGGAALVILLANRHPVLRRTTEARSALTRKEKHAVLFRSPTVIAAFVLMAVLIVFQVVNAAAAADSGSVGALLRMI